LFDEVERIIKKKNFRDIDKLINQQQAVLEMIVKIKKKHIKYVKSELVGTRNTLLFLNFLSETKNLALYAINMVKSHRDFTISSDQKQGLKKIN